MDGRERGWWPSGRLGLTAPEAHVLLHGAKRGADRAFKLAVMEMVGRGWFELAEVGGRSVLGRGDELSRPASPPLAAVLGLFEDACRPDEENGRLPLADLAREARGRYGSLKGYAEKEVLPALEGRGLYERQERRFLGLVPRSRWVLTPAGGASGRSWSAAAPSAKSALAAGWRRTRRGP